MGVSSTSSVLWPFLRWCRLLSHWHCQLCWHHHPFCAGIIALIVLVLLPLLLVVLAMLPLLRWCCCCLQRGLPRHPRLSTCQLNKCKDACKLIAWCKHNKGKEVCTTRALMPVHQEQQCQRDKAQKCQIDGGNNAGARMETTPMWCEGEEVSGIRTTMPVQQENNVHTILAMMPVQRGQQHHCDNSKDTFALTMTMMPLWQGQQHHLDDVNTAIATRATKLSQQQQRRLDCKDTCTLTMATPLQQGQRHQLNNSKDACASMMTTAPLLRGCWTYELALYSM